jgi:hypothetical protein
MSWVTLRELMDFLVTGTMMGKLLGTSSQLIVFCDSEKDILKQVPQSDSLSFMRDNR